MRRGDNDSVRISAASTVLFHSSGRRSSTSPSRRPSINTAPDRAERLAGDPPQQGANGYVLGGDAARSATTRRATTVIWSSWGSREEQTRELRPEPTVR